MKSSMPKHFKFNEKSDYVFYLNELLTDLIQKMDRLERYCEEVSEFLNNTPDAKFVESELYEGISDKVNRVFQYLFNIIGDETKKAVSYRKFRKILFKQKNNLQIELDSLTVEEESLLNEFNLLRNWGLHVPESLLVQKKKFLKMDSQFILKNKKTIPIPVYDYFEIKFLIEIKREIQEVLDSSIIILERMKKDYSSLIGEDLIIEYERNQVKPYAVMKIVQDSWNTQKNK